MGFPDLGASGFGVYSFILIRPGFWSLGFRGIHTGVLFCKCVSYVLWVMDVNVDFWSF